MNQSADLSWRDGRTPVSTQFDDPYFSIEDGLAETRYVFLDGNDLPARFTPGFHLAELGFGTGLNLLAAMDLWQRSGQTGRLRYTGFEAFPMRAEDLERALAAFPDLAAFTPPLIDAWSQQNWSFQTELADVQIIVGDARETLPAWTEQANAWFLDGFAPARNPELWQPDLLQQVGTHTRPGGTLATYTAAGAVRRALEAAGFEITRRSGYGRKRHMTTGRKPL